MENFFDFNNADDQLNNLATSARLDSEEIRRALLHRIEDALFYLFPQGYVRNHCFHIGSVKGNHGRSLIVQLGGDKQGSWYDFSESNGGDIFSLWSEARGFHKTDFGKLLGEINEWLGNPTTHQSRANHAPSFVDDLGKPTAKWDYFDKENRLIACVYRYDTEDGKEFRVWDVKNKKARSPNPRPLYNIPGIFAAKKIILVEGEKSADSLIARGLTATTAMFGANAPIDKTDWLPLVGKEVIIWPDNDDAGIEYAKKVSAHLLKIASFVSIAIPPKSKPVKWDAADAVRENFNIISFLEGAKSIEGKLPSYMMDEMFNDESPMPEDLIAPRVLTPRGMLLIGGAPKVGKSDFIINFLFHLAAGESFLGLTPPRPLKIFYLQAEIDYHYMRERIKKLAITKEMQFKAARNIAGTSRVQMILDEDGVEAVYRTIKHDFQGTAPDILCIDPIRNVFDGGENGSENDNNAMLFFLQKRVEKLRMMINPEMGIILCHHTKKIRKKDVEEDPFQAFSGAGSLRSFYSSGLILHRPSEYEKKIHLYFELRNGTSIPRKIVEKDDGRWIELSSFSERLIHNSYGDKLDAERVRKGDVILQLLADEALKGKLYTANQFSEIFENKAGLGCKDTIKERLSVLSSKGYVKFTRNIAEFSLERVRSKYGILCVCDMVFKGDDNIEKPVLPTHFKCPTTGAVLPVENSAIWVLHDEVQP